MDSLALMNTFRLDRTGLHDELDDRLDTRFRDLRDALRRLAAEAVHDTRPTVALDVDRAVAVLNRACASAPSWSEMTWSPAPTRVTRTAEDDLTSTLARIAEDAVDLFTGSRGENLRACYAPGCVLYFLRDHPRREWCSAGCGNRARVARHYQRHHGD